MGFLGLGAFGEVWRAVVQHIGGITGNREVAVKKLRSKVSACTSDPSTHPRITTLSTPPKYY